MMDRGLDREERDWAREQDRGRELTRRDRHGRDPAPQEVPKQIAKERPQTYEKDREAPDQSRRRKGVSSRQRTYSVSLQEREMMAEIGRFRALKINDLAKYKYQNDVAKLRQDLRSLIRQGLVQRKTIWTGQDREKESFVALTRAGKKLVKKQGAVAPGQAIYAGFVKPAELRHDAAINSMFQKEAAQIQAAGGKIRRIVLDYELKKKAYSPLAKAKALPASEYAKRQAEIAREHGLKVVNGHITLPDLRIEYETREGLSARVDLEVASESYHGSHASEKAAAGFRIYAAPDTATRLSRALEEREITAEILSL